MDLLIQAAVTKDADQMAIFFEPIERDQLILTEDSRMSKCISAHILCMQDNHPLARPAKLGRLTSVVDNQTVAG